MFWACSYMSFIYSTRCSPKRHPKFKIQSLISYNKYENEMTCIYVYGSLKISYFVNLNLLEIVIDRRPWDFNQTIMKQRRINWSFVFYICRSDKFLKNKKIKNLISSVEVSLIVFKISNCSVTNIWNIF